MGHLTETALSAISYPCPAPCPPEMASVGRHAVLLPLSPSCPSPSPACLPFLVGSTHSHLGLLYVLPLGMLAASLCSRPTPPPPLYRTRPFLLPHRTVIAHACTVPTRSPSASDQVGKTRDTQAWDPPRTKVSSVCQVQAWQGG